MKKYDCNKTLDYNHELERLCQTLRYCEDCPMREWHCELTNGLTQDGIDVLQHWSDTHPEEPPRITERERDFLMNFVQDENITVTRLNSNRLRISRAVGFGGVDIYGDMFPFIGVNDCWSIKILLGLYEE